VKRYLKAAGIFIVIAVFAIFFVMVATDPGDNLVFVELGFRTGPSGVRFVTGTIRNNTDGSFFHAQVEINLLDEDGGVVASTVANTSNLGAGETWNFEAPILSEDAVRFRIEKLTCSPSPQSSKWEKKRSCYMAPIVGDLSLDPHRR